MPNLPGALLPFTPFPAPVDLPLADVTDAPLVCVQINAEWMQYLIGCAEALTAQSTWASDDENAVNVTIRRARNLIDILAGLEACPVGVMFRLNPLDSHYWDYSNDGGATWTRQPDTVSAFTPTLVADGAAPGGYDLSVNGGLTEAPIPLFTAIDPNAIIKDPVGALANSIVAGAGVDGLVVGIAAHAGTILQQNGISAFFQKVPGLGVAADAVVAIKEAADYAFPLLALLP